MFKNIGKKIKGLTVFNCVLGIIASVIGGIVVMGLFNFGDEAILIGLAIIVGGCLVAWIGSFVMYGYGELIDKTSEIHSYLYSSMDKPVNNHYNPDNDPLRTERFKNLLAKGLITQEEYNKAINRNNQ